MSNKVIFSDTFNRSAKPLVKKYPSLKSEIIALVAELEENSQLGTDLGGGIRKIRLASKSKGKGKSGGFRVITFQKVENKIILVYIYDKSEMSDISKKDIQKIIDKIS